MATRSAQRVLTRKTHHRGPNLVSFVCIFHESKDLDRVFEKEAYPIAHIMSHAQAYYLSAASRRYVMSSTIMGALLACALGLYTQSLLVWICFNLLILASNINAIYIGTKVAEHIFTDGVANMVASFERLKAQNGKEKA